MTNVDFTDTPDSSLLNQEKLKIGHLNRSNILHSYFKNWTEINNFLIEMISKEIRENFLIQHAIFY